MYIKISEHKPLDIGIEVMLLIETYQAIFKARGILLSYVIKVRKKLRNIFVIGSAECSVMSWTHNTNLKLFCERNTLSKALYASGGSQ